MLESRATVLVVLTWALFGISTLKAEEKPADHELVVNEWLLLPPTFVPFPAFAGDAPGTFEAKDALAFTLLPRADLRPREKSTVVWPDGSGAGWLRGVPEDGAVTFAATDGQRGVDVAYAAAYVETDRLQEVSVKLASPHLLTSWLGGEALATKKKPDKTNIDEAGADEEPPGPGNAEGKRKLRRGKHLLLVKLVRAMEGPETWTLSGTLSWAGDSKASISLSVEPVHGLELDDLLDARSVSSVSVSPDGTLVALSVSEHAISREGTQSWIEVRDASDGTLVRSYRGASPSRVQWARSGRRFTFTTRAEKKGSLWVADLSSGSVTAVLEGVENLGGHSWMPDGKSILYSVTEKAKKPKEGVKRMRDLPDRWKNWRDRSSLYQVSVEGKTRRRLTAGKISTGVRSVSPDGRRLLFTRSVHGLSNRPFSKSELYELDLSTLFPRALKSVGWLGSVQYSPDGGKILALGGPSTFGDVGVAVSSGTIPNDYDTQAYVIDLKSGETRSITRSFDPSVRSAFWAGDGTIHLSAEVGSRVGLFAYDLEKDEYTPHPVAADVVHQFSVARDGSRLVFRASAANRPPRIFSTDLSAKGEPREILFPARERFRDVVLGEVKDWSYVTRIGTRIQGRVHYPRGFDAGKKYPCIVYYYGGTSPVGRSFGGRYPKNYWCEQGYIVYVLQPSGATGYGQEFSSRHVNNWGLTVADEVIQGTRKFLTAHPFVDPERVGCIGASYGGFMTMLLVTRTDLFSAAISHAGISSLASYWGEGFWGYAYSSVASADSYPWNRPDLYVGQSPLFAADKITTPLLLLHGTGDTNVPPGESEQMYTALRLLDKEVEYIRFEGENHWILDHEKRVIWAETIVAWFDKQLKKDPTLWDHLHPDEEEDEEKKDAKP